jgi:hypothetical protein
MFSPAQRWTLPSVVLAALAVGCADGDNGDSTFSGSGGTYPQTTPTQTTPMTTPMDTTGATTSVSEGEEDDDDESSDPPVTSSDPDPSMTNPDPSTSGPDPSMTNPETSLTLPDTSDATTAPMTTDPETSSTTSMTTMPMTTMPMTTNTTNNPGNDPQPSSGTFAPCLMPEDCDPGDYCLTLSDEMGMVLTGYCSPTCANAGACGAAPSAPATLNCVNFQDDLSFCVLQCDNTTECPIGMECFNVQAPNITDTFCY